ncbi:TetR/AcrR family transcriptional regulator [Domibacillus sp. A3M-37]|uniref:TetR/AcrR family transcriptional regulator n=1 Tax=Domibacillus TaxID=1433999 RepID=UPI000618130C|nr:MULTISPECIES: TetR/AcrR family transcriptional regulator [Domibacillus]MCP3761768.1 TetR/AcrR family transcriptional regulator [Domibacillus sp. A3M-37]
MNERKKNVMNAAHALFVEKGYAATSVQDILDQSGISKGTFYNYFPSKNELLISIFEKINFEADERRAEVIAGRPIHDKSVFIQQVKVKMEVNKENNLFALFQGVFVSEDEDLKKFVKQNHFNELRWMQRRFVEVYGERVRPYSVDIAVMVFGIIQNTIHFVMAVEGNVKVDDIIAYAMRRVDAAVEEIVITNDSLLDPQLLEKWQPEETLIRERKKSRLMQKIGTMQKKTDERTEELLAFLQDEIREQAPRRLIIETVAKTIPHNEDLMMLIHDFFRE